MLSEVTQGKPSMHHSDHGHQFSLQKTVFFGIDFVHHDKHHVWFFRGTDIEELSYSPVLDTGVIAQRAIFGFSGPG